MHCLVACNMAISNVESQPVKLWITSSFDRCNNIADGINGSADINRTLLSSERNVSLLVSEHWQNSQIDSQVLLSLKLTHVADTAMLGFMRWLRNFDQGVLRLGDSYCPMGIFCKFVIHVIVV